MRLRNYIALVYALFIGASVLVLSLTINVFAGNLFSLYIKNNIKAQSEEIARSLSDQYDPFSGSFDMTTVQAMGMHFVHQGYIVSLADNEGRTLWDARTCDMKQCAAVISEITSRMAAHQLNGAFQNSIYTLNYGGKPVAALNIQNYGPFFYSEGESLFLRSLNRFLIAAGLVFTLLGVVVSVFIATGLSRPILRAAKAARRIGRGELSTRLAPPKGTQPEELGELSRSINGLAEALENGERWQKRLSADVAHELRTPLTVLRGNVEAMIDGVWESGPEHLESCREEILRLQKLVEDLNSLSVIERDALHLHKTEFDLGRLLSKTAEQFTAAAGEKGIAIRCELESAPVFADQDRLTQVFINLFSNALTYTDSGAITVRLKARPDSGQYEITVEDTGIGIAEEDLPHVFERFYRSDKSRSRNTGGAGIGLAIAAAIVEAHGGRIRAASPAANSAPSAPGSVFTVV
ncbi:MAG: HAMP domain-containing protein, partial [Spirochaetaceae bacterium]|nr:HAMP domain-containing protein [Spirochaetaceae bacterium]